MKISADVIEQDSRSDETKDAEGCITITFKPVPIVHTLPFPATSLTWETMKDTIISKCNLNSDAEVKISYLDEENDKVFISSEEEYKEAIRIGRRLNNNLKMTVKEDASLKQEKKKPRENEKEVLSYRELESGEFVTTDGAASNSKFHPKQFSAEKIPEKSQVDNNNVMAESFPSNMPIWVISYINQMKEEITREATKKVLHRVTEMLTGVEMAPPVPPHFEDPPPPPPPRVYEGAEGLPAHDGIICDHCEEPIYGVRYKCGNCADFDLCERCERLPGIHTDSHIFLKIRHPMYEHSKHKKGHKKRPLLKHSLYGNTDGLLTASLMATSMSAAQNAATAAATVLSGYKHKKDKIYKLKKLEKCRLHLKSRERYSDNSVVPSASWDKLSDVVKVDAGKEKQSTFNRQNYELLGAHFIRDETVPDGMKLLPGTKFTKCWRVRNSGGIPWTSDTVLKCVWGSKDLVPHTYEVKVPHLKPGDEGIVAVQFIAPHVPGKYHSHWQLFEKNCTFGHRLWCNIEVQPAEVVEPSAPIDLSTSVNYSRSSTLKAGDSIEKDSLTKQPEVEDKQEVSQIAEVLTAVQEEQERGELVERKIPVTSHTATPNNTPFDMTPPKSPEPPSETLKDIREIPDDVSLLFGSSTNLPEDKEKSPAGTESEDTASVLSLSSSESDAEYVVVPLPPCFNLKVPFVSSSSSLSLLEESSCMANTTEQKHESFEESAKLPESYSRMVRLVNNELSVHIDLAKTSNTTTEVVSQETGAPEEAESHAVSAVSQADSQQTCEHVAPLPKVPEQASVDYSSSSEISVITSEESSPTVEASANQQNSLSEANSPKIPEEFISTGNSENQQDGTSPKQPVSTPSTPVTNEEESHPSVQAPPALSFAPANNSSHEGVIPVLPEGLVTGALSAAATVYNTARYVISAVQAKREQTNSAAPEDKFQWTPPQLRSESQPVTPPSPMWQLVEMGFCDRALNERLLQIHKGNITAVVNELININDNEWFTSRNVTTQVQPSSQNTSDSAAFHNQQF